MQSNRLKPPAASRSDCDVFEAIKSRQLAQLVVIFHCFSRLRVAGGSPCMRAQLKGISIKCSYYYNIGIGIRQSQRCTVPPTEW